MCGGAVSGVGSQKRWKKEKFNSLTRFECKARYQVVGEIERPDQMLNKMMLSLGRIS